MSNPSGNPSIPVNALGNDQAHGGRRTHGLGAGSAGTASGATAGIHAEILVAIGSRTTLYIQPKYFHFVDPEISLEVLYDTHIRVTAKKFAKNFQILDEAGELKLSDNYFDMQPGSRVLTVLAGKPENLNVLSIFDIR